MGCSVVESGAAELHRRRDHAPPERPERRNDSKLDPSCAVPGRQVIHYDALDGLDLVITDPVSADSMGPEVLDGKLIRVQTAMLHALQPMGFDHVDAVGTALAKESLSVVERRT